MNEALRILKERLEVGLFVAGIVLAVLMVGIGTIVCLCTFRVRKR